MSLHMLALQRERFPFNMHTKTPMMNMWSVKARTTAPSSEVNHTFLSKATYFFYPILLL